MWLSDVKSFILGILYTMYRTGICQSDCENKTVGFIL